MDLPKSMGKTTGTFKRKGSRDICFLMLLPMIFCLILGQETEILWFIMRWWFHIFYSILFSVCANSIFHCLPSRICFAWSLPSCLTCVGSSEPHDNRAASFLAWRSDHRKGGGAPIRDASGMRGRHAFAVWALDRLKFWYSVFFSLPEPWTTSSKTCLSGQRLFAGVTWKTSCASNNLRGNRRWCTRKWWRALHRHGLILVSTAPP